MSPDSRTRKPTFRPGSTPNEPHREARDLALRRLSSREYSALELEAYLKRKEIPAKIVAQTIASLIEEKLLDDHRYARSVTRSQALREKGPNYILQRLQQKGVRIKLSEVREFFGETSDLSELERARQIVERRFPRALQDRKELRRAYVSLLKRGFSDDAVREALNGRTPSDHED